MKIIQSGLKEIKIRLQDFYKSLLFEKDPVKRLNKVIELSEFKPFFLKRMSYRRRRTIANKKRCYLYKNPCFVCFSRKDIIRHHLVTIKNGGDNRKKNVIALCRSCHAKVHPWLLEKESPL